MPPEQQDLGDTGSEVLEPQSRRDFLVNTAKGAVAVGGPAALAGCEEGGTTTEEPGANSSPTGTPDSGTDSTEYPGGTDDNPGNEQDGETRTPPGTEGTPAESPGMIDDPMDSFPDAQTLYEEGVINEHRYSRYENPKKNAIQTLDGVQRYIGNDRNLREKMTEQEIEKVSNWMEDNIYPAEPWVFADADWEDVDKQLVIGSSAGKGEIFIVDYNLPHEEIRSSLAENYEYQGQPRGDREVFTGSHDTDLSTLASTVPKQAKIGLKGSNVIAVSTWDREEYDSKEWDSLEPVFSDIEDTYTVLAQTVADNRDSTVEGTHRTDETARKVAEQYRQNNAPRFSWGLLEAPLDGYGFQEKGEEAAAFLSYWDPTEPSRSLNFIQEDGLKPTGENHALEWKEEDVQPIDYVIPVV